MQTAFDFDAISITGQKMELSAYRGKVLLIVNVASRCGFTPQYAGLEALYRKYRDRGLVVLGFPCGQFLNQEFDDIAETQSFCERNYGVTFPMFAKINVNGEEAHPLFQFLTSQKAGWLGVRRIGWNFTKFLVDRTGSVVARYSTMTAPEKIENDIERLLEEA